MEALEANLWEAALAGWSPARPVPLSRLAPVRWPFPGPSRVESDPWLERLLPCVPGLVQERVRVQQAPPVVELPPPEAPEPNEEVSLDWPIGVFLQAVPFQGVGRSLRPDRAPSLGVGDEPCALFFSQLVPWSGPRGQEDEGPGLARLLAMVTQDAMDRSRRASRASSPQEVLGARAFFAKIPWSGVTRVS